MMQQNMLELLNHFASEKSGKSEKKKMEQLYWRAMGDARKVMTFAEENTEKGPGFDL